MKKNVIVLTLATGCALVMLVIFALSLIKTSPIKGMDAESVIEAYYNGINTQNAPLLGAILMPGCLDEDLDVVKMLYLVSTKGETYYGSKTIMKAEEWESRGRPELPPFVKIFGNTRLRIDQTGDLSFLVTYRQWHTRIGSAENVEDPQQQQEVFHIGRLVNDEITLVEHKGEFRIKEIRRSQEPYYEQRRVWVEEEVPPDYARE